MAGAVEEPIGSNIILFLTPDSGQNLLESNNFVSQTRFRSKPFFHKEASCLVAYDLVLSLARRMPSDGNC